MQFLVFKRIYTTLSEDKTPPFWLKNLYTTLSFQDNLHHHFLLKNVNNLFSREFIQLLVFKRIYTTLSLDKTPSFWLKNLYNSLGFLDNLHLQFYLKSLYISWEKSLYISREKNLYKYANTWPILVFSLYTIK